MNQAPPSTWKELQDLADARIPRSPALATLNDQSIVERIIAPYFQSMSAGLRRRHLVDVGAAYGSVAAVFLRLGWTADLFEPDPACHAPLLSLAAGFVNTCRVYPFAVSATDAPGVPFHQNRTPGLSGFEPSPFSAVGQMISVQQVSLASFLPTIGTTDVSLLKIDTEGRDFEVLQGYDFVRCPPALVMAEFSYFFRGHGPETLAAGIALMTKRGYQPLIFEYDDEGNFMRGNWNHRLVAIHCDGTRIPTRAQSVGDIIFYQAHDTHLAAVVSHLMSQPL